MLKPLALMAKGGLDMSDRVEGIDSISKKDRAELNIGNDNNRGRSKSLIVGCLLLLAILVAASAVAFSFFIADSKKKEVVSPKEEISANYEAGKDKSILDDYSNFFTEISKKLKQKKAASTAKQEAEARDQEKSEAQTSTNEISDQAQPSPKQQPKPSVVKRSGSSRRSNKTKQPLTPSQRRLTGSVTVQTSSTGNTAPNIPPVYDSTFDGSRFEDGSATLRPYGSLDFLLIHGMNIPCSLYTQIISDYSGFVTCRVIKDIYSANGSILLVEAGSVVSGTQKVELEHGKARTFTTWTDIETRNGVRIIIDSLGTGPLGAAGHEVWVDNHFRERFGGAILLSFVDDSLGAISRSAGNNDVQFDNSTDNASDMASKALESSINIAPTGYSYLGQRINILIARDIDMSSVYKVEDDQ